MTEPIESPKDQEQESDQETLKLWKRRGLFAAAWAAVAALVVTKSTRVVEAGVDGDVVLNAQNGATGQTIVYSGSTYASGGLPVLMGIAFQGNATCGVAGFNSGFNTSAPIACGVWGYQNKTATTSAGVLAENDNTNGIGVLGRSGSAGFGLKDGIGVQGESAGGWGVYGNIPASSAKNGIAIYGLNYSSFTGGGPGGGGFGTYGYSLKGHGLLGASGTAGGAGVVGATNGVVGAYAGVFYGTTVVLGDFTVVGGAKSAAVPHPDGTHRRLYCVESPESWFEDFGKAQLECGQANVTIDADFASVVRLDDYHVFLTQYGGHDDLSVTEQGPNSFRVEAKDATSANRFGWRIVAKRKDIASPRFESVDVPVEPILPAPPADIPASPSPQIRKVG